MVSTMNRYKNALKSHGFYHEKVQKCFSHNEKKLSNWVESVCLCLKSLVIFGEIQIHMSFCFSSLVIWEFFEHWSCGLFLSFVSEMMVSNLNREKREM